MYIILNINYKWSQAHTTVITNFKRMDTNTSKCKDINTYLPDGFSYAHCILLRMCMTQQHKTNTRNRLRA